MEAMKAEEQTPEKETTEPNRQQRRIMERVQQEAQETHAKLAKQFFEAFMEFDPDGEELKELEKELIAKWKMYCGSRNLTKEAREMMTAYCTAIRTNYQKEKDGTEVQA